MKLDHYINETTVTEASAGDVLKRFITDGGYRNFDGFRMDLQNTIKVLNKLDKWKKNIFYGKSLGFEVSVADKETSHKEMINEQFIRLLHGSLGISTESNELFEALEKGLETGNIDTVNLSEELGDIMFYVGVLCNALNVNLEDIMEKNNAKLKLRYKDKFSSFYAINRDLDAERKLLEQ